jgi:hypothetical protein
LRTWGYPIQIASIRLRKIPSTFDCSFAARIGENTGTQAGLFFLFYSILFWGQNAGILKLE